MTDLADLVEPLKRELAVPGEFAAVFPSTEDDDLVLALADGFSEAQLDGHFGSNTLNLDTLFVTPDVTLGERALIVIYSATRIIRAQLRMLTTGERYKAGNVEYEINRGIGVLKEQLVEMQARKDQLIKLGSRASTTVAVYDNYFGRAAVDWSDVIADGGLAASELAG